MKHTIKIWLALILMLSLLLAACGKDDKKANEGTTDKGKENNLLEEIKEEGVIKIGMMGTYAPYNFLNDKKEMDGFDADISKELAKYLGVEPEFIAQEFSGMIPSLQAGKFDIVVSQMTITDERKEQMDFTQPYITNEVKVIVVENNSDIKEKEDFVGKNIGVGLGTNDETYLRTVLTPEIGDFTIKTYDDVITSLKDLDAGRIDATINNLYALKPIINENGFKIKAVGEPVKADPAGVAAKKGNEELIAALNEALTQIKEDGTYNEIFKKWFDEEPPAE